MHYFEDSTITHICVHKVGNQSEGEFLTLSNRELALDNDLKEFLTRYFLTPFKSEEYYHFHHDSSLSLNEVWTFVSAIFEHPEQSLAQSKHLAQHLYNHSIHPNIQGGEFYVVYFKDCQLNGETMDAIGLFKSESKENFLKILTVEDAFEIESEEGVNINKLDKGCIVYNTDKENGFVVSIVDNKNKTAEARYWIDEFLHVHQLQDKYFNTDNMMSLYKNYVVKQLPEEYNMNKADQADMLNRTMQYFKEQQHFTQDSFNNEVLHHPEYIDSFNRFKEQYKTENDLEIEDSFSISPAAVKKQNRSYKSIIKLDKNFHIYVHGDRTKLEHGEDDKGKFYKLYFNAEA